VAPEPPVAGAVDTPSHARWIVSPRCRRGMTSRTVFDGTAKPMPTLPPPLDWICELTPMTCPRVLSSGPPELPGLIGASVCRTSSIEKPLGAVISRSRAEMIPAVAVRSRPNGLPIATASSPTCTLCESAIVSGCTSRTADASTLTTARSVEGSEPTIRPVTVRPSSPNCTCARVPSPTTCALVTTVPSRSTRNPVPCPPEPCARMETTAGLAAR
jgi:hypothetical protein